MFVFAPCQNLGSTSYKLSRIISGNVRFLIESQLRCHSMGIKPVHTDAQSEYEAVIVFKWVTTFVIFGFTCYRCNRTLKLCLHLPAAIAMLPQQSSKHIFKRQNCPFRSPGVKKRSLFHQEDHLSFEFSI